MSEVNCAGAQEQQGVNRPAVMSGLKTMPLSRRQLKDS